ncbi:MAG: hypothetical protein Q7J32_12555 [Sphingomonadaceae bacterium]|nr:hypothetical protein [Sphingomonadaceae bacterium]
MATDRWVVRIVPPRYAPQLQPAPSTAPAVREQLNQLLRSVCLFTYRFSKAVSLIEHCDALIGPELGIEPADWQGIALRDAVHSLYHFAKTLAAFSGALRQDPELLAKIDGKRLRGARKEFERHFPNLRLLRNAVAHLGEQLSSTSGISVFQQLGAFIVWEGQVGARLSMAVEEGRQVEILVDEASQARLQSILETICNVFAAAPGARWEHVCG